MSLPMIRVNVTDLDRPMFVRADAIERVEQYGDRTTITLTSGCQLDIKESPETIAGAVAQAIEWAGTRQLAAQMELAKSMQSGLVVPVNGTLRN